MRIKLKIMSISYLSSVAAILGCILLSGCSHIFPGKEQYTYKVLPDTLHEIETIELKKAEEEVVTPSSAEPAPAAFNLSLEECRAFTLENNLDIKVQLINPTIAAEYINQEEARFESTFSGRVIYSKSNTPVATTLEIAGNKVDTVYADLGVNIPLRSGGNIKFNLADTRSKTDSTYSVYNPSFSSEFSTSISHPLLRNAGKRVNL